METNVQVFVPTVGAGLNNLGNTCFMNATLQAMFYVSQFMNFINKHKCCKSIIYIHIQMYYNHSLVGIKQKECCIQTLAKICCNPKSKGTSISPTQLHKHLPRQYNNYEYSIQLNGV